MRPDPVLAGVYAADGGKAIDVAGAVAGFGRVRRLSDGPLLAAVGGPVVDPGGTADCLIDGRIDNLDEAAPGPGTPEERLARAWLARGDNWLADLRGPFALLLWDRDRRRGVLARDLIGLRPVFYTHRGNGIAFATDLETLVGALPSRPVPDRLTVARWIADDHDFGYRTLYEGVARLEAGCLLAFEDERVAVRRFAQLEREPELTGTPEEIAVRIAEQVGATVARLTSGAQRPALTLSGGLDSSMVAGAARGRGISLHAYSAVFPRHETIDEESLIADVIEATGMASTRLRVEAGSAVAGTLEYLARWGVPTMSVTNAFWPSLLQRAAAQGTDVLLSGEGGDELFITRFPEIAQALRDRDVRRAWALVSAFPTVGSSPGRKLRLQLLARYGLAGLLPARLTAERESRASLMAPRWRAQVTAQRPPTAWKRLDGPAGWAFSAQIFRTYCDGRGIAEHLTRVARMGDVDERHPLLDLDLVRLMLRVPSGYTFSPFRTRPLQRMAMEGRVPDSVRMRAVKSYFSALADTAVGGPDRPVVMDLLGPGARIGAYTRAGVLAGFLERPPKGMDSSQWALQVLDLVKIESWLREQEAPGFAVSLLDSGRLAPTDAVFDA